MLAPKKIGITGGIGSGKSVVSTILRTMGYPVYDSDERAKFLMNHHPEIRKQLITHFGESVYTNDQLNKTYLAACIFTNPEKREMVNSIVHPVVRTDFAAWSESQKAPIVFQESAILFETGGYRMLDATLLVTAPEEIRIKRVMERDQTTRSQVQERIAAQLPANEVAELATFVIQNDEKQLLIPQIESFIRQILRVQ